MKQQQSDKLANNQTQETTKAWWHYGHAWLVFGGPAAVVVASLITVYIAVTERDPMIDDDYYKHGIEINSTLIDKKETLSAEERNALQPALKARNHAATGVVNDQ